MYYKRRRIKRKLARMATDSRRDTKTSAMNDVPCSSFTSIHVLSVLSIVWLPGDLRLEKSMAHLGPLHAYIFQHKN